MIGTTLNHYGVTARFGDGYVYSYRRLLPNLHVMEGLR
jgi:hypothetical protein